MCMAPILTQEKLEDVTLDTDVTHVTLVTMKALNIRNVEEEMLHRWKLGAAADGVTLREWVIGRLDGDKSVRADGNDRPIVEEGIRTVEEGSGGNNLPGGEVVQGGMERSDEGGIRTEEKVEKCPKVCFCKKCYGKRK